MKKNLSRIEELLSLLEDAHKLYASYGDVDGVQDPKVNKKRGEIMEDCEFLVQELEENGIDRAFSVTYLCYGDVFLSYELGKSFTSVKSSAYALCNL